MDDITTTGNTFIACKILLTIAGAKSINCHALGHTSLYLKI